MHTLFHFFFVITRGFLFFVTSIWSLWFKEGKKIKEYRVTFREDYDAKCLFIQMSV